MLFERLRQGVRAAAGVQGEELTQLTLLGAGHPGHRVRVMGAALDEGEGLQHRVVQVRAVNINNNKNENTKIMLQLLQRSVTVERV